MTSSTQREPRFVRKTLLNHCFIFPLKMSSSSNSSPDISDNESENDNRECASFEDPIFENDSEPLATEEEATAYVEQAQREEEEQQELLRRFSEVVPISSW